MIRVLVADDSPTARALLVQILRSDRDIEVVGEAANGLEAVEMTRRLRPDLVTREIMVGWPTPIVVVTGGLDKAEVSVSMLALREGAVCALRKPPGPGAPEYVHESRQLIETVKAMSQVRVVRRARPLTERPAARPAPAVAST